MSVTPELEVKPSYYERHREQMSLSNKLWRGKNRERRAIYLRQYREQNRKQIRLKEKEWYDRNQEYKRQYAKQHAIEQRRQFILEIKDKLAEHFSLSCFFCGKHDEAALLGVSFHEIHGRPHERRNFKRIFHYILEHPTDFAPLCRRHHKKIHWLMEYGMTWSQIIANPEAVERVKIPIISQRYDPRVLNSLFDNTPKSETFDADRKKNKLKYQRYKLYYKAYNKKNRESRRLRQKDYRKKHPEQIALSKKNKREVYFASIASEIRQYFPSLSCCLCGGHDNQATFGISFHEIHGCEHDYRHLNRFQYILAHHEDFVPLCRSHHQKIHLLMRNGLNWKTIINGTQWEMLKCQRPLS